MKIPNINEKDEEIIVVEEKAGDNIIIEGNKSKEEKININKAAQTEIETLPGIGPSTALKIINYRNEHGKFKNIEDIKTDWRCSSPAKEENEYLTSCIVGVRPS